MAGDDPSIEREARQAIWDFLARARLGAGRRRVYLVSYPRSGSTLVREYFSILQGRPQLRVYDGDVVSSADSALTSALDGVEIIKSHQMPADDGGMIYLVRDGRNAALSFLYMAFLFGGHRFSELTEVYEGIRHLDAAEGCWADHVAEALRQATKRPILFVRYEDLTSGPEACLAQMARFLNAEIPAEVFRECVRRQERSSAYARNPYSGYLYEPAKGSIYDILKQYRREDYWRRILDSRSKLYFHGCGSTHLLMHFGYEHSANWWKD